MYAGEAEVAEVFNPPPYDEDRRLDNACLIAAAPAMLKALKHARDNCIGHPDQMIDEAIAKAEREES